MHPDQRYADGAVQQHEARTAHAGQIDYRAKHDRQDETTEAAGQADHTGYRADIAAVIVGDEFEYRGLADRHGNADHEQNAGEQHWAQTDMKGLHAVDCADGEIGLRIRQQKEGDPAHHITHQVTL